MIVFENARVFDGVSTEYSEVGQVVVEGTMIKSVGDRLEQTGDADIVDLRGAVLMPGLIDVHVHTQLSSPNLNVMMGHTASYAAAHATRMLKHAIDCGFTSLRDVGGGDIGLAHAVNNGLIPGPRLFFSGRVLSMTGGHGDVRAPEAEVAACGCGLINRVAHIVDGVDEVRHAAREELRRGAHCLKIMVSGGVLSPTDPIWMEQFTDAEIAVAVEEAKRWRTYVAAHAHTADAVERCARLGVRTIEHATLVTPAAAAAARKAGCFIVPTLAIVMALLERGDELGLPEAVRGKAKEVTALAFEGFEIAHSSGVPLGFGTDLLGDLYDMQCQEFLYRRDVQSADAILRSVTSIGADILQRSDLGRITPGATADILVVDGDPLHDIGVLAANGRHLPIIMKEGRFHKRDEIARPARFVVG
jgi:imidazolonepropionase-like amidohydrolase